MTSFHWLRFLFSRLLTTSARRISPGTEVPGYELGARRGSSTQNVLPWPRPGDSTQIRPP
jgi:hypothetical protein